MNNALINAVEASEKTHGEKRIELRSYEKGSLFFVEVENNFDGGLIWEKDAELPATTKEDFWKYSRRRFLCQCVSESEQKARNPIYIKGS